MWRSGRLTALASIFLWQSTAFAYDWTQFNFDSRHSGNNTAERKINATNVRGLTRLFAVSAQAPVEGAPVYLQGISTITGIKDVIFLTTMDARIIAFDAHTGATIWQKQFKGTCALYVKGCKTQSSPAAFKRNVVFTYGLDGKIHQLSVFDGKELTTLGFPQIVTIKPAIEKVSGALSIATDKAGTPRLYAATSNANGDNDDYQGHVTAINLKTGAQATFNAMCSSKKTHLGFGGCPKDGAGIWGSSAVTYNPFNDRIYFATGNSEFNPALGYWSDSVLGMNPAARRLLWSHTPLDYVHMQFFDEDYGSSSPAVMPVASTSKVKNLLLQAGKVGGIRLLDLDKGVLGKAGGEIEIAKHSFMNLDEIRASFAIWTNPADKKSWAYLSSNHGLAGFRLDYKPDGTPTLKQIWPNFETPSKNPGEGIYGSTAIIANKVLYHARKGAIEALDPVTGNLLWSDTLGGVHWASPIVANGVLYVTDDGGPPGSLYRLHAWTLK